MNFTATAALALVLSANLLHAETPPANPPLSERTLEIDRKFLELPKYEPPKVGIYLESIERPMFRLEKLFSDIGNSQLKPTDPAFAALNADQKKKIEALNAKIAVVRKKVELMERAPKAQYNESLLELVGGLTSDMRELATTSEKMQEILKKHYGSLGENAARNVAEARDLDQVKAALKKSGEVADFRALVGEVDNETSKVKAVEQGLDNAVMGVYVQAKLQRLLQSKELCASIEGCKAGGAGKGQNLKGLFDKGTHGN